jgi:hypothetical protein
MPEDRVAELRDIVTAWQMQRQTIAARSQGRTSAPNLREFVETMNALTRRLIRVCDNQDPEFYTALFELATNAGTLTTPGANIFGDGQKMTDL